MKKYDKIQTFKTDEEMDSFLRSLSKKSEFVRFAILEKMERDNLTPKKDNRKKVTMSDLMKSFDDVFKTFGTN
jgi:hypothetical protein